MYLYYIHSQGIHLQKILESIALGKFYYFFLQCDVILWISMRSIDSYFCIFKRLLPRKYFNVTCFKMPFWHSKKKSLPWNLQQIWFSIFSSLTALSWLEDWQKAEKKMMCSVFGAFHFLRVLFQESIVFPKFIKTCSALHADIWSPAASARRVWRRALALK